MSRVGEVAKKQRSRSSREPLNCKVCGKQNPKGKQEHLRTTCSRKCMLQAAKDSARVVVDSQVMSIKDTGVYLDILDEAWMAPAWRAKSLRAEAKAMLKR